ncbi:motility associated factor glycosyltransferase family protein [Glaciecola petra]|uniref:6-hydroxymethylpterin diphosphokinase MptE-like protein n=1 Tax=Glaciecola petra TaxID=3075602 RepID=A0ABU2ZNG6_9ALTE|nr:6-hydroxymethylpterin diphosphokinase MptE-like protein [Aestuariibacter sp. P117]MDT0593801.1 6-hydroxymethylpterin diphosphokinase MptE-like protein [Aestuariibacter sp. P117]
MLTDIRLHLEPDDEKQSQSEQRLAGLINSQHAKNVQAFMHYVPSIGSLISQIPTRNLSVFVDKNKQTNIVDFNTGRCFYPINVDENISQQVENYYFYSSLLCFSENNVKTLKAKDNSFTERSVYAKALHAHVENNPPDALVILGLGKATHIPILLNSISCSKLVIYESDWQLFKASLSIFDWANFLENATNSGIQLFFQIGDNIHQFFKEINELHTQLGVSEVLVYQHQITPVFNKIVSNIRLGKWHNGIAELSQTLDHSAHFLTSFNANHAQNWTAIEHDSSPLYLENLASLLLHFPDLHAAFEDYHCRQWQIVRHNTTQDINIYNINEGNFFAGDDPKREALLLAQHFKNNPSVDGLAFGYSADKLKHYVHNSFICQLDARLQAREKHIKSLPKKIKVLLVFGLAEGYLLASLLNEHEVENLIICEPNPDFFAASLHAIDWSEILNNCESNDCKLYINIGESSSRLFKDLMSQFMQIGPHLLNETFIVQAYDNPMLAQVLNEVRQQLMVIFSMGENFDHVVYGIAHTFHALHRGVPVMRSMPQQYLAVKDKSTPIFIVGNGPSLDDCIDVIKEHRESAIVISCGTALQALHRNGICPDFHGEVEQNRANFDWASRIDDPEYLKQITLLSVNGIHPDTCDLYKNVLMAFKSGESSSQTFLAMLNAEHFTTLDYAYPTVTNLILNIFLTLGFEQLYLVGVDLGFADQNKHHSKDSGYYQNGKQLFDYQSTHNTTMRVKGNHHEWVYTKTEFNISRMILEQLLREQKTKGKNIDCFNLSNGVFIEGTRSLHKNDVLITTHQAEKQRALKNLQTCFISPQVDLANMLAQAYSSELMFKQVRQLEQICAARLSSLNDVDALIQSLQAQLNVAKTHGGSLYFYYFYNSINYLSAGLSKAAMRSSEIMGEFADTEEDLQSYLSDCNEILGTWRVFIEDAKHLIHHQLSLVDTSEAFSQIREQLLLKHKSKRLAVYVSDTTTRALLQSYIHDKNIPNINIIDSVQLTSSEHYDCVLFDITNDHDVAIFKTTIAEETSANIMVIVHQQTHFEVINADCTNTIMYLPNMIDVLNASQNQQFEQGELEAITIENYLHHISARAQDYHKFAFVFCKPSFKKTGLINASTNALSDLQSEYDSKSVSIIKQGLLSMVNTVFSKNTANGHLSNTYMFKHYLAVTKPESNTNAITLQDATRNRGLLMHRPPKAFELLGPWLE